MQTYSASPVANRTFPSPWRFGRHLPIGPPFFRPRFAAATYRHPSVVRGGVRTRRSRSKSAPIVLRFSLAPARPTVTWNNPSAVAKKFLPASSKRNRFRALEQRRNGVFFNWVRCGAVFCRAPVGKQGMIGPGESGSLPRINRERGGSDGMNTRVLLRTCTAASVYTHTSDPALRERCIMYTRYTLLYVFRAKPGPHRI